MPSKQFWGMPEFDHNFSSHSQVIQQLMKGFSKLDFFSIAKISTPFIDPLERLYEKFMSITIPPIWPCVLDILARRDNGITAPAPIFCGEELSIRRVDSAMELP